MEQKQQPQATEDSSRTHDNANKPNWFPQGKKISVNEKDSFHIVVNEPATTEWSNAMLTPNSEVPLNSNTTTTTKQITAHHQAQPLNMQQSEQLISTSQKASSGSSRADGDFDYSYFPFTDYPGMNTGAINSTVDETFLGSATLFDPRRMSICAEDNQSVAGPSQKRPIHNDDDDDSEIMLANNEAVTKADIKRMRNTEAARLSRRRKNDKLHQLQAQVSDLSETNRELERQNMLLKSENQSAQMRVNALEKQVEELHNVLLAFGRNNPKSS
jgi:hypothetical protein